MASTYTDTDKLKDDYFRVFKEDLVRQLGGAHTHGLLEDIPSPPVLPKKPSYSPFQKLAARMDWDVHPFHHLTVAQSANKETYYIFIVTQTQALTLEDGAALYPSDELVTKIRLLAP